MMKRLLLHSLLLLLPVLLATLLACGCEFLVEDPETLLQLTDVQEESDMSVSQLIDRMHEATDPKNVWRDSKSYRMRQSVRTEERHGLSKIEKFYSSELRYRQPGELRQTSFRDGNPFKVLIHRDGKAWDVDPAKKTAREYQPGFSYNLFRVFIGMSDPRKTFKDLFSEVEIAVVYPEGKGRCYRIICRTADPGIAPYVVYVNADTFLTERVETVLYTEDGAQYLYRSEPLAYKWVENVKIPVQTRVTIGERSAEDYLTDEFMINPEFPDSDFEVPQGVKINYIKTK